jgi:hypothetical protein
LAIKLILTWDILPGQEQKYFEFVVRDFIPGMQHLGMEPSDAWFTMYGDQPQIMAAAQMSDISSLEDALESSDWEQLTDRLLEYVENFNYKVVEARSGFQM